MFQRAGRVYLISKNTYFGVKYILLQDIMFHFAKHRRGFKKKLHFKNSCKLQSVCSKQWYETFHVGFQWVSDNHWNCGSDLKQEPSCYEATEQSTESQPCHRSCDPCQVTLCSMHYLQCIWPHLCCFILTLSGDFPTILKKTIGWCLQGNLNKFSGNTTEDGTKLPLEPLSYISTV